MRLKEPLYGIRSAGVHPLLHLGFLIGMIYIEGQARESDFDEGYEPTKAADTIIAHRDRYPSLL